MQWNQNDPGHHAQIEVWKTEGIKKTGQAGEQKLTARVFFHGAYLNERTKSVATVAIRR
jgi:hypothetical protein